MNVTRIAAGQTRRQTMRMMATEVIIFQLLHSQILVLGMETADKIQQMEVYRFLPVHTTHPHS
jgi:hypothetical protein